MGIGFFENCESVEFIDGDGGAPVAFIYSDFENDNHVADGEEVSLTDIWVENITDWASFNPLNVDANGLWGTNPVLNSAYTSGILENMSIVIGVSCNTAVDKITLETADFPNFDTEGWFQISGSGQPDTIRAYDTVNQDGDAGINTRRKVGMQFTAAAFKLVSNGGAIYTAIASDVRSPPPTDLAISIAGNDLRLHNIAIYTPALSDAALQALTT